ncbi:MAG: (Na+)-NQR maturation NqrM [Gammaproteobacteria bacterium]|nr:MAG: (Na+)-NQR maturation NqrM [Gammaproteobacteria bacterium]TDJ42371.1 MAG: (Na+)-NQR maturation NqrM [Gammaproteobacteria bacterium]
MSFVLVFIAMLAIVAAMSVGVMFGRRPIQGSCGGLGQLGIDAECDMCGGSPTRCADSRSEARPGSGARNLKR